MFAPLFLSLPPVLCGRVTLDRVFFAQNQVIVADNATCYGGK